MNQKSRKRCNLKNLESREKNMQSNEPGKKNTQLQCNEPGKLKKKKKRERERNKIKKEQQQNMQGMNKKSKN